MGDRLARLSSILEKTVMDTYFVEHDCSVAGQTIKELDLRKNAGTTIIAIARGGHAKTNPEPDFRIEAGDILVLLGSHAQLNEAFKLLKEQCPISEGHE